MTGLPAYDRDRPALSPAAGLTLSLALILLAELSRHFTIGGFLMSAIWPPAGLFVGAGTVFGYRALLYLMPALLVWMLWFDGNPLAMALITVIGQGSGAALAAGLMRRFWARSSSRGPFSDLLALYTRAALAGGALTSLLGGIGYRMGVESSMDIAFHDLWLIYWAFEALGIILFAPLAFAVLRAPRHFQRQLARDWSRTMPWIWLGVMLLLIALAMALNGLDESAYASAIGFSFFPLLCWFILQCRAANVLIAIPLFAALFVSFSLNGLGGLPAIETVQDLIRSLLLVGGLVVMAQVIAAVTAERTQLVMRFQQQARSDYLTGLNNDRAFASNLTGILEQVRNGTVSSQWLVYLDVLDADRIQDLLGYESSQQIEKRLGAMLMGTVGPSACPSRIGEATFAMILTATRREDLNAQLERLYSGFDGQVLEANAYRTQIRVSIGAVALDGALSDPTHYLSAATEAAHQASQQGQRIRVIQDTHELIEQRQTTSFQIERLKSALRDGRLELYAQLIQPFSEQDTGLHYEILIRLRDPDSGLIGPGGFLPVAETFGFMLEIDQWVIRTTLRTLADNHEWLSRTSKCAINLAGTSLSNGELVPFIADQLKRTGVPAGKISFEITETEQIHDREAAVKQVQAIRALGCSVSLDDFGTGLATFDYLRSFELDFVKIDGVFVRELLHNPHDQSMVQAICKVARSMNLRTIAEFVEGEDLIDALRGLGVDYGQGFGIAKPRPLHEIFQ